MSAKKLCICPLDWLRPKANTNGRWCDHCGLLLTKDRYEEAVKYRNSLRRPEGNTIYAKHGHFESMYLATDDDVRRAFICPIVMPKNGKVTVELQVVPGLGARIVVDIDLGS